MAVSDDVSLPAAASGPGFPPDLAHYTLRARLGEGGHGEVHEAWDGRLQRSVAIKRIRHEGPAGAADLMREARMAASLRHAAFVKVHAIEESGASRFIVMELVPGRTLKQVLADGRPGPDAALGWIRQAAEAMRDAHASGLVHGDLKPSNLMLEPDGRLRILDFGLAQRQDLLATTTLTQPEPQGTIAYMAPERLLGSAPDARGDVYALGVILYEALAGTRPFATLNGLALAAAQVQSSSDSWHYPDTLAAPLIALVRAMTAKQPEQRLAGMDEVLRRLDAAGGAGALPAPIPAQGGRRPRRAAWIAGAVLLAAVAGATAWHQIRPDATTLVRALAPYSEAREIASGLEALKVHDRPGELDKAAAHFNRILARSPDQAAAVAGMALVHAQRYTSEARDEVWLQKADAGAQLALKLNGQLALSQIASAAVLGRQRKFDPALAAYERALNLDPSNYFAWRGKVEALREARRYPAAQAALDEALRRFPDEAIFPIELGVLKYEQHDYPAAEQAFRRSIALQPDAVLPYANLNSVLLVQDRTEEAMRILQQGLQIRPSARLYSSLGNALFLRGDYTGAAEAFEHAVAPAYGAPRAYLNWANLGDALLWLPGREAQARHAYDKARELLAPQLARAPGDVALVSRMALYSARAGDSAGAATLVQRALDQAPGNPSVQFRAGVTFELLGRRDAALEAIGQARKLGYPLNMIEGEPTLTALRRDPAYE
jgi:tetratricopeptide (TPR) repeat protein